MFKDHKSNVVLCLVLQSGLCVSGDVGDGRGGPRITHLTGSVGGGGVVEDEPRFPRLDQCAHFHYEYVELPPLQVRTSTHSGWSALRGMFVRT